MTDQEEFAALQAENATLREQLVTALADVRDLQARLAKGSHKSSTPPPQMGSSANSPGLAACGARAARCRAGR